jgi:hypothetical protein
MIILVRLHYAVSILNAKEKARKIVFDSEMFPELKDFLNELELDLQMACKDELRKQDPVPTIVSEQNQTFLCLEERIHFLTGSVLQIVEGMKAIEADVVKMNKRLPSSSVEQYDQRLHEVPD